MTVPPEGLRFGRPAPANDNRKPRKRLRVAAQFPQSLAIQWVEIEVFAQLLDDLSALVANDNQEPSK